MSLLLTIAFAAQNIRLRTELSKVKDEIGTIADQKDDVTNLQTQVDTLKKENAELTQQLNQAKANIKTLETKPKATKVSTPKRTTSSKKTTSKSRRRR